MSHSSATGDAIELTNQRPATGPGPSLAVAVGRGFSWLTLSIVAGKVLGAVTQLLLGRWISDEQFGDIAIMLSIATVVKVFQDGGVPQVLVQRGAAAFERSMGAAFWLSMTLACGAGLVLAASAPVVAAVYEAPALTGLLWIVVISLPLSGVSTFLRA